MSDDGGNDNNYSCDYSSPSNDDYCSSYTTADQDTSTYTYTATAPEDNWTEQHEVTTLSFSDTQCSERPEHNSTEDRNSTRYTPANETTVEYTPSSGIIESREVLDYRTDDIVLPIFDFPREREYSRVNEYNEYIQDRKIYAKFLDLTKSDNQVRRQIEDIKYCKCYMQAFAIIIFALVISIFVICAILW